MSTTPRRTPTSWLHHALVRRFAIGATTCVATGVLVFCLSGRADTSYEKTKYSQSISVSSAKRIMATDITQMASAITSKYIHKHQYKIPEDVMAEPAEYCTSDWKWIQIPSQQINVDVKDGTSRSVLITTQKRILAEIRNRHSKWHVQVTKEGKTDPVFVEIRTPEGFYYTFEVSQGTETNAGFSFKGDSPCIRPDKSFDPKHPEKF